MDEPERRPSRPIMEQWYSLNIGGAQRQAVKDSFLDNLHWVGAAIRHDRPRVVIAHCTTTIQRDPFFTEYTAEILRYGQDGALHSFWACSVTIPNRFLAVDSAMLALRNNLHAHYLLSRHAAQRHENKHGKASQQNCLSIIVPLTCLQDWVDGRSVRHGPLRLQEEQRR